jgi:pimeloyl-ACP methyl ester carboxylesterase
VIIDAGHFVWEEAPAEYASAVLDSITDSTLRTSATSLN